MEVARAAKIPQQHSLLPFPRTFLQTFLLWVDLDLCCFLSSDFLIFSLGSLVHGPNLEQRTAMKIQNWKMTTSMSLRILDKTLPCRSCDGHSRKSMAPYPSTVWTTELVDGLRGDGARAVVQLLAVLSTSTCWCRFSGTFVPFAWHVSPDGARLVKGGSRPSSRG